jgi:hypothetical protein
MLQLETLHNLMDVIYIRPCFTLPDSLKGILDVSSSLVIAVLQVLFCLFREIGRPMSFI